MLLYAASLILIFSWCLGTFPIAKKYWGNLATYWRVPERMSRSSRQAVTNFLYCGIYTKLSLSGLSKCTLPVQFYSRALRLRTTEFRGRDRRVRTGWNFLLFRIATNL